MPYLYRTFVKENTLMYTPNLFETYTSALCCYTGDSYIQNPTAHASRISSISTWLRTEKQAQVILYTHHQ